MGQRTIPAQSIMVATDSAFWRTMLKASWPGKRRFVAQFARRQGIRLARQHAPILPVVADSHAKGKPKGKGQGKG